MKISKKTLESVNKIAKFQMGGEIAAPAPAPEEPMAPEGGEDPMSQLIMAAQQAVEANDGQLALGVCAGLLELINQSQGGAEQETVYAKCGGKMTKKKVAKKAKK